MDDLEYIDILTRKLLVDLLSKGNSHVTLNEALQDLPARLRGVKPEGLPYSIWQLVDHIRIAQWDILKFTTNRDHLSPKWPSEYWPRNPSPGEDEWQDAIDQIASDRQKFIDLLTDTEVDLYEEIDEDHGQTVFREAMLIADHTSYHIGQIILIRRLLGSWPVNSKNITSGL